MPSRLTLLSSWRRPAWPAGLCATAVSDIAPAVDGASAAVTSSTDKSGAFLPCCSESGAELTALEKKTQGQMCVLQGGMQDGLSQAPQPWQVNFQPGPRPLSFHWRHASKYPAHTKTRSRVQCSGRRRRPDQVGAGLAPSYRVGESTTGAVTRRRRQRGEEAQRRRGAAGLFACLLEPSRGRIEAVSRGLRLQWP